MTEFKGLWVGRSLPSEMSDNDVSETNYFEPLFDFEHCGAVSKVAAGLTAVITIMAVIESLIVLEYDNHLNRRANLLTKLNSTVQYLFIIYSPGGLTITSTLKT